MASVSVSVEMEMRVLMPHWKLLVKMWTAGEKEERRQRKERRTETERKRRKIRGMKKECEESRAGSAQAKGVR